MTKLNLLHLKEYPILEQLRLEEKLLQESEENWCIINEGSPPAIVMGISGKPELLICPQKLATKPIPVIRRFSGGGTVVVDEETLFVSFIFAADAHSFPAYPEPILRWSASLYEELFAGLPFALRDQDYAIGERKCGGNAQYIRRGKWLHHTTFLWNFCPTKMSYLLYPPKTPSYRQGRDHEQFLCKLHQFFSSPDEWVERLKQVLSLRYEMTELAVALKGEPKSPPRTVLV